jgi:hydroxysqualene synthase
MNRFPKCNPIIVKLSRRVDHQNSGYDQISLTPLPHLTVLPTPINHYENFPVASFLCPRHLRAPIIAIYQFARAADDIADEGAAAASKRLSDLVAFRADLMACSQGLPISNRWPAIFIPLGQMIEKFNLPVALLADLLDAFEQDVAKSRDGAGYETQAELLDYCRRSANPVGRLMLHLYGVTDATSLIQSDHICTALQLINFWQDLSTDIPRGRFYLTEADCRAHGVIQSDLSALKQTPNATALIADQVRIARATMQAGSPLVKRVPGRAGWELRAVVHGGLRILDKIETIKFATLNARPKLTAWDAPIIAWRALWM